MAESGGAKRSDLDGYFPSLDGWRFVAFFIVFVSHGPGLLMQRAEWPSYLTFLKIPIVKMLNGGGIGVAFFFVLSGFLITYLILREVDRNGRLDLMRFYARRTLRIWPLYYAVIMFGLVLYPKLKMLIGMGDYIQAGRPLYYWAFLSNLNSIALGNSHFAVLGVTWSVSVEEQFYLFWPVLFLLLPRRAYGFVFPTIMALSLVFRATQTERLVLDAHTFSVIGDLALGGQAAYLVLFWPPLRAWLERLTRGQIAGGYVLGCLVVFYQDVWSAWRPLQVAARLLCGLFFAFIILEQNFAKSSPFKMASNKWMTRWGQVTYGLYLLHEIAIQFASIVLRKAHVDQTSFLGTTLLTALAFPLSLLMARVSYRFYERPFLKIKEAMKPRRAAAATVPLAEPDRGPPA